MRRESHTPNLPSKIAWLKLSGPFPMDMRIPPFRTKILLESSPLRSRILVRRLAVRHIQVPASGQEPVQHERPLRQPAPRLGARLPEQLCLLQGRSRSRGRGRGRSRSRSRSRRSSRSRRRSRSRSRNRSSIICIIIRTPRAATSSTRPNQH